MRIPLIYSLILAFTVTTISPSALRAGEIVLPAPGTMVQLSPTFAPPALKGIKVHPDNPFKFEFILDQGDLKNKSTVGADRDPPFLKEESTKLIKYFLASLTIPEKDLWVNLSPYEKDRIVPERFGQTEMGRDLLAQDYLLKQVTASLVYPEGDIGKQFWKRVYEISGDKNIPVSTFNKVWIVPNKAVVYENAKAGTAYVVESSLKVMTEQDYLATNKALSSLPDQQADPNLPAGRLKHSGMTNSIIHDLVIPQLNKEVNEGANFVQLRQVYNSLILATWYKKKIRDSILAQVYADKNKIKGTEYKESTMSSKLTTEGESTPGKSPNDVELIYARYLQAFKKGAYNYIKEEQDPVTQQMIPRKYFSGGVEMTALKLDAAMSFSNKAALLDKDINNNGIQVVDVAMTAELNEYSQQVLSWLKNPEVSVKEIKNRKIFFLSLEGRGQLFAKLGHDTDITREFKSYLIAKEIGMNVPKVVYLSDDNARYIPALRKTGNTGSVLLLEPIENIRVDGNTGTGLEALAVFSKMVGHWDFNLSNLINVMIREQSIFGYDFQHTSPAEQLRFPFEPQENNVEIVESHISKIDPNNLVLAVEAAEKIDLNIVYKSAPRKEYDKDWEDAIRINQFNIRAGIIGDLQKLAEEHSGQSLLIAKINLLVNALVRKEPSAQLVPKIEDRSMLTRGDRKVSLFGRLSLIISRALGMFPFNANNFRGHYFNSNIASKNVLDLKHLPHGALKDVFGVIKEVDQAVQRQSFAASLDKDEVGGINFNPDKINLETKVDANLNWNKKDNKRIQFHVDPAMLKQLQDAPGFIPVIINIAPLNDIRAFLGVVG